PLLRQARRRVGVREVRGAQRTRAARALRGLHRAVRGEAEHRGGDGRLDRAHAAAAGGDSLVAETRSLVDDFVAAIRALETVNAAENQDDEDAAAWAIYMRDKVVPATDAVRNVADRLEKVVADDLWPLPKYSEVLFIK